MSEDPTRYEGGINYYDYAFNNAVNLIDPLGLDGHTWGPMTFYTNQQGMSAAQINYWVRFPHGVSTFEAAVQNTRTLISAAKNAGVKRIVHVSIANPSLQSPLGYYEGKAQLEQAVFDSGLSYTILRPTGCCEDAQLVPLDYGEKVGNRIGAYRLML